MRNVYFTETKALISRYLDKLKLSQMIITKGPLFRIIKRLENRIKSEIGKIAYLKTEYNCPRKWYGNDYGGFYVNSDLLDEYSVVYSFGIGQDISFDLDIINNHNCQVFGFDPTPKSIAWVKEQNFSSNFHFEGVGIGKNTRKAIFNLPKNEAFVSGSLYQHALVDTHKAVEVQLLSFEDILHRLKHKKIDVLKMDIEGAEYEVIDNILNEDIHIHQILLEIHERFFEDGKSKTEMLLQKLRAKGYKLFAISDSYQEISFIKA